MTSNNEKTPAAAATANEGKEFTNTNQYEGAGTLNNSTVRRRTETERLLEMYGVCAFDDETDAQKYPFMADVSSGLDGIDIRVFGAREDMFGFEFGVWLYADGTYSAGMENGASTEFEYGDEMSDLATSVTRLQDFLDLCAEALNYVRAHSKSMYRDLLEAHQAEAQA